MPQMDPTDLLAPMKDWLVWLRFPGAPKPRGYLVAAFDTKDEAKAYAEGKDELVVERNPGEIRSKENLNPLPDGKGEDYYVPVNIAAIPDEEPETETPQLPQLRVLGATRSTKAIPESITDKYRPLFEDVTRNLIDLERRMVMREAEKRLAAQQSESTKSMVDALTEIAARPIPAPQITMSEGMVKVDVHPGEAPQVTVNVPKQPAINFPEPKPMRREIKRDPDNNITEIVEVPA